MNSLDTTPETEVSAVSAPERRIKTALIKVINSLIFKFSLIFILLGGVISFSMYVPYMRYIKETYTATMAHVLDRTAGQIVAFGDTEVLKEARLSNSPAYRELVWVLDTFRQDYNMLYIYYMLPGEDGKFAFFVDTDEDAPDIEYFDSDYIDPVLKDAWRTGELTLSKAPVTNEFGTGISAYLPILKDGIPMGIAAVDYDLSYIQGLQRQALIALVAAIVIAAVAAFLLALHINQTIVFPVREMKGLADAMANTRFDVDIPHLRKDELGAMQRSLIQTRDNLQKAMIDLKAERDEITAMKDSLKTGVFLMNKEYVIQGHYSKALEQVLAASNLEGTKFTAILASSLNARDLGLVQDYFDMVQSRSLPQKKLDSFNPLSELNYVSVETQKEKSLRCGFTSVEREGQVFVLGVVEDITAETKLKKRLAEEEAKRQEEMRSLFEVIHVSPTVFSDFVTDAGYNFDQVMKLLKDGTVSSADALVRIYQLMHAVKSDAYILGLKSFGDKLHALEGKLKTLRDTENPEGIPLDDMLQLTVDIEKILQEKDKMVSTLDTVRAYQTDVHEKREQDEYVLVESLTRACEKVSADLEKKVRFTVGRMDSGALKSAPRREVKEMLTQIVRNAVYHGIESPEARVAKGKNETGVIELSVQKEGNMLRISLRDDGKGLDFAAIKRKAIERHLLSEEDANGTENQGRLLQTIFAPEFSTAESASAHAGRGIGLNLVQDQVRELGGTIKVQTATDKGTAFVMLIPAR